VLLREWRAARRTSQVALAAHAGISPRHLSFIETGRATPSREMVQRLSDALEIPLRERNALLRAAGYAAMFSETPLDAPAMGHVRRALDAMLKAFVHTPAIVVNRRCDILMSNGAARRLMVRMVSPEAFACGITSNMVRTIFSPQGARPFIENWNEVASEVAYRIRRENVCHDDRVLREIVGPDMAVPAAVHPRAP
jgi:transcriptional regulator with XRE-family HTH domain